MKIKPMLAEKYKNDIYIIGWFMSEKYDGVRAIWTGKKFVTRNGNSINPPRWFIQDLPPKCLDGELFMGRGLFQKTVSTVRKNDPENENWHDMRFIVFDMPSKNKTFERRLENLNKTWLPDDICLKEPQFKIESKKEMNNFYQSIINDGGEGIIIKDPESHYIEGRSDRMLKIKPIQSSEATITGYKDGKGAKLGEIGSMVCQWDEVSFCVRAPNHNVPEIGSIITFKYQGLTVAGKPRFPIFQVVRDYD